MAGRDQYASPVRTLLVAGLIILLLLAIWLVVVNPRQNDEAASLPPITDMTGTHSTRPLRPGEVPAIASARPAREAPPPPKIVQKPVPLAAILNATGEAPAGPPPALTPAQAAKAAQVEDYAAQVGDTRAASPSQAPSISPSAAGNTSHP